MPYEAEYVGGCPGESKDFGSRPVGWLATREGHTAYKWQAVKGKRWSRMGREAKKARETVAPLIRDHFATMDDSASELAHVEQYRSQA